jgi:Fe-S-cluster containining protein
LSPGSGTLDAAETKVCLSCGACCFGPANYVQVFPDDLARLSEEQRKKLVVLSSVAVDQRPPGHTGDELFMRMENGHCAALDRSGGKFTCSIYEQRPLLCRVFKMYASYAPCPPAPTDRATEEMGTVPFSGRRGEAD